MWNEKPLKEKLGIIIYLSTPTSPVVYGSDLALRPAVPIYAA